MKRPAWLGGRFGDPDATHSLRAPPPRQARTLPALLGLATVIALLGALVGFRHAPSPPAPPPSMPPLADEAALLAKPTDVFSLWRFSAAPGILVAIFPSLHAQALSLNRVAALIERPGMPRDHVLDDATLAAEIGRTAESFDTYYYGHDYRADDLARFYALADRGGAALNDMERLLRERLRAAGFFAGAAPAALITLPPHGDGLLDPSARATILHHELSHGAYFTNPAYAAYVDSFWTGLTAPERAAFRHFLGEEGYDTGNDDLMRNETQAYLVFTADPRMFDPDHIGVPEAIALRKTFIDGIPLAWLRRDADAR
jgi:hypothetical protein